MSISSGVIHVVLGADIFWEQEDPQEEVEECYPCPVCRTHTDIGGPCSRECYQAWIGDFCAEEETFRW